MPDETGPPAEDENRQQPQQPAQERPLSRREQKHQEREQRRQEQRQEQAQQERSGLVKKKRNQYALATVLFLVFAGIGYALYALATAPSAGGQYDLSGIPNTFVHWHGDVDILICGENRPLPLPVGSGQIGTARLHTHGAQENIESLPGTDGNGVYHTEGVIPAAPAEHTLGKFLANLNVPFSETRVMEKQNGDACPDGSPGAVSVTLNRNPLANATAYLPRDGDRIVISFGTAGVPGNATNGAAAGTPPQNGTNSSG